MRSALKRPSSPQTAPPRRDVAMRLASHPLLRQAPPEVRDDLLQHGEALFLEQGELLYTAGSDAERVYLVLSGCLQIEYPDPGETRGFVSALLAAPNFLGECQVLHQRPWSGTGVALSQLLAFAIPKAYFERLLKTQAELGFRLYRELAGRFLGAINAWKLQQKATPEQLLGRLLLCYWDLEQELPELGLNTLHLRQSDLARATKLRRETVNRLLSDWSQKGQLDRVGLRALLPEAYGRLLIQRWPDNE